MDLLFLHHWDKSQAVELMQVAYHFYQPGQTGWLQAVNFMRIVDLLAADLPLVLDPETAGG